MARGFPKEPIQMANRAWDECPGSRIPEFETYSSAWVTMRWALPFPKGDTKGANFSSERGMIFHSSEGMKGFSSTINQTVTQLHSLEAVWAKWAPSPQSLSLPSCKMDHHDHLHFMGSCGDKTHKITSAEGILVPGTHVHSWVCFFSSPAHMDYLLV